MKYTLLVSMLFTTAIVSAQTDTSKKTVVINSDQFTRVEKEAKFPGGVKEWVNYLQTNLNTKLADKYIPLPKGQKLARQTVRVQFLVNKDGSITDAKVINPDEVHSKLGAEAIRVITKGPKWEPARQNGRNVIYQAVQSITFEVSEE